MSLEPGTNLLHYRVVDKLGAGGMGEVYLADDTKLGRKVALKLLPEALSRDPERLARFEREAKLLASLNHPHVASLYGLEEADHRVFLTMELAEGEDLGRRLDKGAMPVDRAVAIALQIAEGLEAAHAKNIVRRDLKPANVMLSDEGEPFLIEEGAGEASLADDDTLAFVARAGGIRKQFTVTLDRNGRRGEILLPERERFFDVVLSPDGSRAAFSMPPPRARISIRSGSAIWSAVPRRSLARSTGTSVAWRGARTVARSTSPHGFRQGRSTDCTVSRRTDPRSRSGSASAYSTVFRAGRTRSSRHAARDRIAWMREEAISTTG